MDVVKEDMAEVEVTEKDTELVATGEGKSSVATPDGKSRKKKKKKNYNMQPITIFAVRVVNGNTDK